MNISVLLILQLFHLHSDARELYMCGSLMSMGSLIHVCMGKKKKKKTTVIIFNLISAPVGALQLT